MRLMFFHIETSNMYQEMDEKCFPNNSKSDDFKIFSQCQVFGYQQNLHSQRCFMPN